ncbi:MAG: GxxExxY protein [Bacteroidota bacterium]
MQDELTQEIIGAAYRVHNTLGSGFLEKVYENALRVELRDLGLAVKQQFPISVFYKGFTVGQFIADLFVEDQVILELKAVETLIPFHYVQLVNYLNATQVEIGLLINFGESVQVKRRTRKFKYP